jgi:predicted RNase H-like HicB family nuclease
VKNSLNGMVENTYTILWHDGNVYTIIYTEEDGGFTGYCKEMPGVISEGETFEELQRNMLDAMMLVLKSLAHDNKTPTK